MTSITGADGKCTPPKPDNTVVSTSLNAYYPNLFNVTEGLVADPFRWDQPEQLQLWKNPNNKTWMWVNTTSGAPVYIQDVRTDMKKTVVYYLPNGISGSGVSSYNFQNFACARQ